MLVAMLIIVILGFRSVGGFIAAWQLANEAGRLNFNKYVWTKKMNNGRNSVTAGGVKGLHLNRIRTEFGFTLLFEFMCSVHPWFSENIHTTSVSIKCWEVNYEKCSALQETDNVLHAIIRNVLISFYVYA